MSVMDMQGAKRNPRADFILRVFLAITIGWLGFALIAVELHGHWPEDRDKQQLLVLAAIAATIISFKAFQMSYPVRKWTRLGAAMVLMNVAFAYGYLFAVVFRVWTSLGDNTVMRASVYASVVVTGSFAFVELIQVPGKNDRARPRLTIAMAGIAAILGGALWVTT